MDQRWLPETVRAGGVNDPQPLVRIASQQIVDSGKDVGANRLVAEENTALPQTADGRDIDGGRHARPGLCYEPNE
jgi:hypothetical protein